MKEINLLIAEPSAKLQEEIKQRIKYEDSINLIAPHNSTHYITVSSDGGDFISTIRPTNISIKDHSQNFFRINNNRTFSVGATEDGTLYTLTLPNFKSGTFALTSDLPTVGSGILTIQKNGTAVDTFSANATSAKTINITVPTNNNELTNGAGYQTASDVSTTVSTAIAGQTKETWTFTLDDDTVVTKTVVLG